MLEGQFIVENAILRDRVRELEGRLAAAHLILAKNVEELPALIKMLGFILDTEERPVV